MNTRKALSSAIALLMLGGTIEAQAITTPFQNFYVTSGQDFDSTALFSPTQVNQQSTGEKNTYTYSYQSSTVLTDLTGNGVSIGDKLDTNGGLYGLSTPAWNWAQNVVNNFTPTQGTPVPPGTSNNGYGTASGFQIGFGFEHLQGSVYDVAANGTVLGQWGAGLAHFYVSFDFGATQYNFMNLAIDSAKDDQHGIFIQGKVDFTGIGSLTGIGFDPTYDYRNLFSSSVVSCGTSHGFFDIWANCNPSSGIRFEMHNDSKPINRTDFAFAGNDGVHDLYNVATTHTGDGGYYIPEPSSLALLGLGLMGFAGFSRRNIA